MFHLMMHSTHFIYGYMVKDHSDSVTGNPLPPLHRLLFPISSKGFFYMYHPTDRTDIYHSFCYTSRVALVEMRKKLNESTMRKG